MMIYEICAVIVTLIFVLLAFYIIQTLRSLMKSMTRFHELVAKVENKWDPISLETLTLLQKSNDLTASVQEKIDSFDPVFNSIHHLGGILEESTTSLHERTLAREEK